MSIESALQAEHTNKWLKEKAAVLKKAAEENNWQPVLEFIKWAESEPFSE